jgi:hypothetical protein
LSVANEASGKHNGVFYGYIFDVFPSRATQRVKFPREVVQDVTGLIGVRAHIMRAHVIDIFEKKF